MIARAGRAFGALVLLATMLGNGRSVGAQDSALVARHVLPIDVSRIRTFRHTYEMRVSTPESTVVIGFRTVSMDSAVYDGRPAWLLVETRSGVVPASDTVFLAPDLRPIHWSSHVGPAQLALEFVGDSVLGGIGSAAGRRNIVMRAPPDLVLSASAAEALLPLLPLDSLWRDSVTVVSADVSGLAVLPAELVVLGEEIVAVDTAAPRQAWVIGLRTETRNVVFWIEKGTGVVLKSQHPLPAHVGTVMEYRLIS